VTQKALFVQVLATLRQSRRRAVRVFVVGAVAVLAASFARAFPRAQTVHYVLGDGAGRVEEVEARWAQGKRSEDGSFMRAAAFHYAPGQAPRIITHEPRLADGDYTVEIDIVANRERRTITREVALGGGTTNIELGSSIRPRSGEAGDVPSVPR
jgi:hypothetical protein